VLSYSRTPDIACDGLLLIYHPPPSFRTCVCVCVLLTSRFNDTSSKMKQKPDVMLVSTRAGGEGKEGLSKARM
jgi:hypothetical protein